MRTRLRKLAKAVPPGTHLLLIGTLILGAASYAQISIAGHALSGSPKQAVSELWSLVMTLSLGLFFPIEQELTRVVAARAVRGEGARPVLRRAGLLTGSLLAVICGGIALSAGPLADTFFGGDRSLVWAFAAALVGMALVYLVRGILAGLGLFNAYGTSLALDGALRILLACGLLLAGSHSALDYGLVMAVAPLLAMLYVLPATVRGSRSGPLMPWRELFQNLTMMITASMLTQLMVNAAVITTALVSVSGNLTFALLSAGVLCRVPLFVFGSIQPTLMTGLSSTATAGDFAGFRRLLVRTCAVIGGLGLLAAVPTILFGPWLISVFFGAENDFGPLDFFWFSAGTLCYMLAMVLGQTLMALRLHRKQMIAWLVGTAVLGVVTFLPGPIVLRIEAAYALGSMTTALCMLLMLVRVASRRRAASTAPGATAASTLENA